VSCTNEYETNLDSLDTLEEKVTFEILDDGTNPPVSLRYRTIDTTI